MGLLDREVHGRRRLEDAGGSRRIRGFGGAAFPALRARSRSPTPGLRSWRRSALIRVRRGLLHTTGAIVLNRADVCTVHYLHNGRAARSGECDARRALYRLNAVARRSDEPSRRTARLLVAGSIAGSSSRSPSRSRGAPFAVSRAAPTRSGDRERRRHRAVPSRRAARDARFVDELGIDEASHSRSSSARSGGRKGVDIAIAALAVAPSWHLAVVGQRGRRGAVANWRSDSGSAAAATSRRRVAPARSATTPRPTRSSCRAPTSRSRSLRSRPRLPGCRSSRRDVGAVAEIVNAGGGVFVDRRATSLGAAAERARGRTPKRLPRCPNTPASG